MLIFLFLSLVVAAVAVIFALQNTTVTEINFLFWSFEGSLALMLLIALALGALISFFASIPTVVRANRANRSLRKEISELEASLAKQKVQLDETEKSLAELQQRSPEASPGDSLEIPPDTSGKSLWQG